MATYNLIQTVTVGSGGAASIEFTSIPQTYTDLQLLVSARSNRATEIRDEIHVRFNSNTSGYSVRTLRGDGSAVVSNTGSVSTALTRMDMPASGATANIFGFMNMYIPNYTTANQKAVSIDVTMENNAVSSFTYMIAGLWANTAAITSITMTFEIGPLFLQHSSASLYGISKT